MTVIKAGTVFPVAPADAGASLGARYRAGMAGLGRAQKPGEGVPAYTRWVNRRLARYAAAAGYALGWTPNMMTAASAAFSAVAIALLIAVPAGPATGVAIAVLLAVGYLLDSADGQVARLQGSGSPAGEWLDHVVDAIRTPAIHVAVLVGFWAMGQPAWVLAVTLAYCLVSVAQFMSQILAEQLARSAKIPPPPPSGNRQSFVLIPTDTGTFCWMFLLWGFPPAFVAAYTIMFLLNAVHSAVSMRRKYQKLRRPRVA
ncbi:CDP-alcohol phosphatidyltransferase family protein [Cryobacterium tepidiphilum]|nr:CDP-alcohol phosphatidyltransferase family protein [Cryobacterium tepidiphilum]